MENPIISLPASTATLKQAKELVNKRYPNKRWLLLDLTSTTVGTEIIYHYEFVAHES